jgi:hypothetical protein
MANEQRRPGKRGANPRDERRNYPVLEHFLRPWEGPVASRVLPIGALTTDQLPPVPATMDVDRASNVGDWPMYCNGPDPSNPPEIPDGVGDCTIAERCHSFSAQRVYAGFPEPSFHSSTVIQRYSQWGGYVLGDESTDNGCDPTVVLQGCVTEGIPDINGRSHRLAAWAAFGDPTNLQLMAQVLYTFGTVAIAGEIAQAQEDQFVNGQPWQYEQGSPDLGGHMFCLQRRAFGGTGINKVATWGELQAATRKFMRLQIREAYAVVSEDWLTANGTSVQGFDMGALLNFMPSVG